MNMKKNILIIFLIHISIISFGQKVDSSFVRYWKIFRESVLDSDFKKLDSLTQFPLIVRGTLDSDPEKYIGINKFKKVFRVYLKQANAFYSATDLNDIKEKEQLSVKDFRYLWKNQMSVDDLEFEKIKGHWKLTLIYINTADQEENNIK